MMMMMMMMMYTVTKSTATPLLLIYSFKFRSSFLPTVPLSRHRCLASYNVRAQPKMFSSCYYFSTRVTVNFDHRIWPRYGQNEPLCQICRLPYKISRSSVILFNGYCSDTSTHTHTADQLLFRATKVISNNFSQLPQGAPGASQLYPHAVAYVRP